jgi:hypothetical protein
MMTERQRLLASIATTTADYRVNELGERRPEYIDTWVSQFDAGFQVPILREIDYVFKKTYFSKQKVEHFLERLIVDHGLVGKDPCGFWKGTVFLDR